MPASRLGRHGATALRTAGEAPKISGFVAIIPRASGEARRVCPSKKLLPLGGGGIGELHNY